MRSDRQVNKGRYHLDIVELLRRRRMKNTRDFSHNKPLLLPSPTPLLQITTPSPHPLFHSNPKATVYDSFVTHPLLHLKKFLLHFLPPQICYNQCRQFIRKFILFIDITQILVAFHDFTLSLSRCRNALSYK